MSDLKPSDVEGIVKDLEAQAMSRVTIPADATTMQKYTALFEPIAGDEQLNRSQVQWFLGACVANVAGEFRQGIDPNWAAQDIKAVIKQFAEMVGQPGAKMRQLYDVFETFKEPASRVPDLGYDHHRLVYLREKDPTKRLPLLQQAASDHLTVGDLQKQINQAQKGDQDEHTQILGRRGALTDIAELEV